MKRAYSRLERDKTGVIRVVFYDADTSLPVDDLTGYSIVAIDNKGQTVPVNQAQPSTTPQPAANAPLPTMENPPALEDRAVPNAVPQMRENGGRVSEMDLEPTNRFVGPGGLMGLALGDKNADGNTGWRNGLLTSGLGLAAGAVLGGVPGLVAGAVAKGVVNSDGFKNKYNSREQLSKFGVGIGEPDVPAGAPTGEIGFGVTPSSRPSTPTASPQTATVTPSGQPTSIPVSSVPRDADQPPGSIVGSRYDDGTPGGTLNPERAIELNQARGVNTAAPSMSAFNRREPTPQTGYRQGLKPEIDSVAQMMEQDFGRTLNSGFRDPARNARVGGARNSEHTRGNAIDVDVSGMTNEEKRGMLEVAVQNGVRGVGIYKGGTSIHLDTRQNPMSWGPRGFSGSPVSEMPEWSKNTLSAMHGAGPGGRVLPDKGPTPVSRDMGLATMPEKSRVAPDANDLAFTSRPDFKDMSIGRIASTGYGKVPDNNTLNAMAYTIAGETMDFGPQAVANLAATIHNRISTVGPEKTFTPDQYNALAPGARAVTDANYKKHGGAIKDAIESMYAGGNVPKNPEATHYYNPELANPAWGSQLKGVYYDAGHRIGTLNDEYKGTKAQQQEQARIADDNFTNRSLASQAGRNVENEDKAMSGDRRTTVGSGQGLGSRARTDNSSISSRAGSGKDKDDRGVGLGSRSSSTSKSSASSSSRSNNSSISSRSGSGKEKDDRSVGLGSKSTSSASKSSPSKSNAGSDKSTSSSKSSGGNSSVSGKSGSGKDKDDKGVGSSSSSGSKSSGSSSGGGKGDKK